MVDADTAVNVHKDADIKATSDVSISSNTAIRAASKSDSTLPAAIAVSVLNSGASTTVDGNVLTIIGNADILAEGNVDAITQARKSGNGKSLSGGFIGTAVVLQDVRAEAGKNANIEAGKNVEVRSAANARVDTSAISVAQDGEGRNPSKAVEALGNVFDLIRGKIRGEGARENLDAAVKKLKTGNGSVKLDEDAGRKGDVRLTFDEDKNAVTVNVNPWLAPG